QGVRLQGRVVHEDRLLLREVGDHGAGRGRLAGAGEVGAAHLEGAVHEIAALGGELLGVLQEGHAHLAVLIDLVLPYGHVAAAHHVVVGVEHVLDGGLRTLSALLGEHGGLLRAGQLGADRLLRGVDRRPPVGRLRGCSIVPLPAATEHLGDTERTDRDEEHDGERDDDEALDGTIHGPHGRGRAGVRALSESPPRISLHNAPLCGQLPRGPRARDAEAMARSPTPFPESLPWAVVTRAEALRGGEPASAPTPWSAGTGSSSPPTRSVPRRGRYRPSTRETHPCTSQPGSRRGPGPGGTSRARSPPSSSR